MTLRTNSEDRRTIRQWLEDGQRKFEAYQSWYNRLTLVFPPDNYGAMLEKEPPDTDRYPMMVRQELVVGYVVSLPGDWLQLVAVDPKNDEPIVFGAPWKSGRKRREQHADMMRWIKNGE